MLVVWGYLTKICFKVITLSIYIYIYIYMYIFLSLYLFLSFYLSHSNPNRNRNRIIYIESMGKTLQNLFKSYCSQLLKLELLMASKTDLIAVEEATLK
jgi:hypothetical protein